MNVQIGQVWEDADPRRSGRTFKVVNIDNDIATCEVLTGKNGISATSITSFIKLKRFRPKYYKLLNAIANEPDMSIKPLGTFSTDKDILPHKLEIFRRKPKAALVQECKNYWPGDWREVGPFVMLTSENSNFEVSVRQLDEFKKPFEIRVKLYAYSIFKTTVSGTIEDAIKKIQDYFLVLNYELNNFIVGDLK